MIISERNRDIGGFTVGRLLPFRTRRMIGPFIFIDHMGPAKVGPADIFDIGQHPHIGLSTLTYLLKGEILHKDSLGSEQVITPGAVNWMTAGKGVVHTEKTPDHRLGKEYTIHGYQIWVALPLDHEDVEPSFHHVSKANLPVWHQKNLDFNLIAGSVWDKISPVPVYSELYMIKVDSGVKKGGFSCKGLFGSFGICPVYGMATFNGTMVRPGDMLVVEESGNEMIEIEKHSSVMIFGGKPFDEKRFIDWNFVSSDKEKIEKAKERWRNKEFEMIEGENSYVPLPSF